MRLISVQSHRYGGVVRRAGDSYAAEALHARALVAARLARYDDREMLPELTEARVIAPTRKRYTRRKGQS